MLGRGNFIKQFQDIISSPRAEFVALYGRRRVGKTLLLNTVARKFGKLSMIVTGESPPKKLLTSSVDRQHDLKQLTQHNVRQRAIFQYELERTLLHGAKLSPFKNWREAFEQLIATLGANQERGEIVIVLDELPWLAGRNSDLVSALDHAWNSALQYDSRVKLLVCGSAASWILTNLIRAKGGLHNRLTLSLRLPPFSFEESVSFLHARGATHWSKRDLLEIYQTFGGVPYYLNLIDPQLSPAQNIAKLLFSDAATLKDEFESMFYALFGKNKIYSEMIKTLSSKRKGLSRQDLIKKLKISSGGVTTSILSELEESGFIKKIIPFNNNPRAKAERGIAWRVWDEFSLFWLRWGEGSGRNHGLGDPAKQWLQARQSASYYEWSGHAFEMVCFKEVEKIRNALGIGDIRAWIGPAVFKSKSGKTAEIDLLFDRADNTLTLVEIKAIDGPLEITTTLQHELERKRQIVQECVGSKKTIQLCILARDGVVENQISKDLSLRTLSADCLFL
jgi:AAA+ ATPase superfamily predicted ATPase